MGVWEITHLSPGLKPGAMVLFVPMGLVSHSHQVETWGCEGFGVDCYDGIRSITAILTLRDDKI